VLSYCVSAAADINDRMVIMELRNDYKHHHHHHHHEEASAAGVSDCVQCAADTSHSETVDDTHDTVADVPTHCNDRRQLAVSKTRVRQLDVEPSSPDDRQTSQQHSDAINLLLWKLTELERRITLGNHVRHTCIFNT